MKLRAKEVDKALHDLEILWGRPPRSPQMKPARSVGAERAGGNIGESAKPDVNHNQHKQQYSPECQKRSAMALYHQRLISKGTLKNWFAVHPEWRGA